MNNIPSDPLHRLFGDRRVINRELLANTLKETVWLDRDTATFHFHQGVRDRIGRARSVLIALLAQKALVLAIGSGEECMTPKQIEVRAG
jgi:hypothetical protein